MPIPTNTYDDEELKWEPGDTKPSDFIPTRISTGTGGPPGTGPGDPLKDKLHGYSGGRLAASNWGASARYGVGDVELLAFDPSVSPGLDDVWVQSRMVDLINRSWDRRSTQIFPPCAAMMPLVIASPRPVPSLLRFRACQ